MSEKMTGIGAMEAAAEVALTETQKLRAEEERAYAERRNSPEVQALNDQAELAIFGSGRRSFDYPVGEHMDIDPTTGRLDPRTIDETKTYKYGTGDRTYTDLETGEVIASPDSPKEGRIDEILKSQDPKYGRSEPERGATAKSYVDAIERLQDSGFELTQAKMIMDLKEKDYDLLGKLVHEFMTKEKLTGHEAHIKADKLLARADAERQKFIKENGLFTMDEYDALRKKRAGGKSIEDDITEEVPVINPEIPLPEAMGTRLRDARDRYCQLTADRRKRLGNKDKAELDEAYQEYMAALSEAGGWVADQIQNNPEYKDRFANTLQELAVMGAVVELHAQQGLIGEYRTERAEGKRFKWFYNMWAGWGGRVLERDEQGSWHINGKNLLNRAKKFGTMTVIGAPLGVAAAAVGAAAAGPIAGALAAGYIARGVTKALAGAKINKEADASANVAQAQRDAHFAEAAGTIVGNTNEDENWVPSAGDVIDPSMDKTKAEVRRNRKRVGASAVAGAVGGFLGAEFAEHVLGIGGGGGGDKVLQAKGVPHEYDVETPTFKPNVPHDLTGDGRFPWTVWTEKIGSNGTPKIEDLVAKAEGLGIHFQGNGQGGGAGAIEWVRLPDGTTYTDNAHINAYLDYVNTH